MINWNEERVIRIAEEQQIRQLAITEATTDLVATIDIDGFFINMNQGGYDLLELSIENDINQLRLASFYTKSEAAGFLSTVIPGALAQGAWHCETMLLTASGKEIPSSQVLVAHKDNDGDIKYFSIILRDIRFIREAEKERRDLLEQLHQAKKMETVGRMAGGVAHDFNNIITVIMGYAEIGLLNLSSGQNIDKNQLEIILDSAHKAARLSNQLLEFSSRKKLEPQVLDLNEVIENSRQLIVSLMGEKIQLEIELGQSPWSIKFNRTQLEQIILNLAINAKDALDSSGKFSISTEKIELSQRESEQLGFSDQGQFMKLTVTDTGCGIDKDILEYIYDPFFTTKDKGKGTGLGLSTVFTAVKQNHGQITVSSKIDYGTTFCIYMPHVS